MNSSESQQAAPGPAAQTQKPRKTRIAVAAAAGGLAGSAVMLMSNARLTVRRVYRSLRASTRVITLRAGNTVHGRPSQ